MKWLPEDEIVHALGGPKPRTRIRRGVEVVIPEKWVGKTAHPQTIRKRPSKNLHKHRKVMKHGHERRYKPGESHGLPD